MGALGLIAGTAFLFLAARAVQRRLPTGAGAADLLVFLLCFTTIQSLVILVAGLTGTLSLWPLAGVSVAGIALLWTAGERPHLPAVRRLSDPVMSAVLALGILVLVVKSVILSPYWGDAVMYHLPVMAEWIQAEEFVHGFNHDPRIWLPSGFQLVETWWVVFLRHDLLVELGGLQMLAIALAAVHVLARKLMARAGMATMLFAYLPVVILHVTACGNDLAVGAMVLSGFALASVGAAPALLLLPILVGAGIKPTAVIAAVGIGVYAAMAWRPATRINRGWSIALILSGLILAGFWYVRNAAVTGHPFSPMIQGDTGFHVASTTVSLEQARDSLRDLPRDAVDRSVFTAIKGASWGWFILAIGFPAAIVAFRGDAAFRRLALGFLAGWLAVLASVESSGHHLRYALWFPALFALAGARLPGPVVLVVAILASALNFVATVVPVETTYLTKDHEIPAEVPGDAAIACVYVSRGFSYPLYNRDFSRRVFYPRSMEELRASGVRYVFVNGLPDWAEPINRMRRVGGRVREVR